MKSSFVILSVTVFTLFSYAASPAAPAVSAAPAASTAPIPAVSAAWSGDVRVHHLRGTGTLNEKALREGDFTKPGDKIQIGKPAQGAEAFADLKFPEGTQVRQRSGTLVLGKLAKKSRTVQIRPGGRAFIHFSPSDEAKKMIIET
ncbi:MAG: hypothetical protein V4760_11300, partial [Bdellovibrionota bacterium]